MERKLKIEVAEETSETASDMAKTLKVLDLMNCGSPFSVLLPPGTKTANITVAMRVATTMHDDAVPFIHFSPSFNNSLCSSVNRI